MPAKAKATRTKEQVQEKKNQLHGQSYQIFGKLF
jgi:hypothetical protein